VLGGSGGGWCYRQIGSVEKGGERVGWRHVEELGVSKRKGEGKGGTIITTGRPWGFLSTLSCVSKERKWFLRLWSI